MFYIILELWGHERIEEQCFNIVFNEMFDFTVFMHLETQLGMLNFYFYDY